MAQDVPRCHKAMIPIYDTCLFQQEAMHHVVNFLTKEDDDILGIVGDDAGATIVFASTSIHVQHSVWREPLIFLGYFASTRIPPIGASDLCLDNPTVYKYTVLVQSTKLILSTAFSGPVLTNNTLKDTFTQPIKKSGFLTTMDWLRSSGINLSSS
ncbi:uncharacterized protein N7479_000600 [Penicillium vulpinum]|uniref:Uncharacterized protein n=1 Tax=Penicillium vulpinum TaxID=29845 RepID=A0A1V6S5Y6_9EURO|nr:uncharacterized protein N7479_000600 [Penicillium vulpinum]KAJ5970682.1 hypothetical protein N7479_000600 [Penicillium vulpinum]OQE09043.1 hypothetical protein PENVUL_c007G04952 [Penicillium vulpinum]